jgi:PTH1 family peptidyl-tRNA hydrolase
VEHLFLIAGLGNPGSEYAQTRHNAGFMVLDRFAARRKVAWKEEGKFQARVGRTDYEGRRLLLVEPLTYMNSSGQAVQAVVTYFKVPLSQLLVVVDDADLGLGEIRLRANGSSGGHHGLESIEQHVGTREYARQRIGIGRRADGVREITDFVLGRFAGTELPVLEMVLERARKQIECWVTAGVQKAMNEFNGLVEPPVVKES